MFYLLMHSKRFLSFLSNQKVAKHLDGSISTKHNYVNNLKENKFYFN